MNHEGQCEWRQERKETMKRDKKEDNTMSLACVVVVVIKQMPLLNAVCRQENALKRIKSMSSLHPSYSNTALRIFMGLKS